MFKGWNEGKILFAPTYKYSQNSDSYAGENTKSKRKRRTPAWCGFYDYGLHLYLILYSGTLNNHIFVRSYLLDSASHAIFGNSIFRCDRILWRGNKIEQLSYVRGESRFSDHRPVCASFAIEVEVMNRNPKFRKGYSCAATKFELEECLSQRPSFC